MSIFVEEDFAKMVFNPSAVPKGKPICDHYTKLQQYQSFLDYEDDDKEKVIRYILYLYDKGSPTVSYYTDLQERKEASALLANFDPEIDQAKIQDLFMLEDEGVIDMILEFLRSQNWMRWSLLISSEQTFYEYQRSVMSSVTSDKGDKDKLSAILLKSQLMDDCDKIVDRIERYYQDVFGTEEVIKKAIAKRSTPEAMVM